MAPKIENKELDEDDIGKLVTYTAHHGEVEVGRLSSYSVVTGAIFVRFKGPNGEGCDPRTLSWGGKKLVQELVREAFGLVEPKKPSTPLGFKFSGIKVSGV